MPAQFIQELFIQKEARADHDLFEPELDQKQLKAKRKTMQTGRRIEIMNQREQRGKRRT